MPHAAPVARTLPADGTQPFLVDVMSGRQKLRFFALLDLWAVAQFFFWNYWLSGAHLVAYAGFVFNTVLLLWFTALPAYFLFFVARMKRPNPALPLPSGLCVAMVVTKAPSEPFVLLQQTLLAMLAQSYPHDTWLADEQPTADVLAWCEAHGVRVSTRHGVARYHQPRWPRRTRTKEGNLAYFYDHYGYAAYDIVSQLDADHVPAPGYLEAMLRPFADPRVGYVSAPSICDANAATSWAARARLHAESSLHGALQAGYNSGWAPLCIGSHYAVRTVALQEIGGLGPELAEDHSTTLLMNAHGWRGVHAFDAEAHGDGPITFADCMTQEFQWSRSLTVLLLTLYGKRMRTLPLHLKAQFLFSECWYLLFGLTMLGAYLAPIAALLSGQPLVNVQYLVFWYHALPVTLAVLLIVGWVKRNGWVRPADSRVVSWESALFQVARWPWLLAGCLAGVAGVVSRRQFDFRVTPKARDAVLVLPLRLLSPYFAIATIAALAVLFCTGAGSAAGYYWLTLLSGATYLTVGCLLLFLYMREQIHE
jgi:cellulose synthase (UDP-forming)